MKNAESRLQVLERLMQINPPPSYEQFKTEWEGADALSRSVLAAEAESGDFDGMSNARRRYMTAIRSYLLQMGEIDPDAKSLRQIAAEMEDLS